MKILVLTDNSKSWYIPFGQDLVSELLAMGIDAKYIKDKKEIVPCDICFLLSCTRITEMKFLSKCKRAIVIHGSDLPAGKGFSPVPWQILEGKDIIPVTLLEAAEKVDSGEIYFKENLVLEGHELLPEIRRKLGQLINSMALRFTIGVDSYKPFQQKGVESFYPRRTRKDDEINIDLPLREQINHLRIADNENYPLFFRYNGHRYLLKVEKDDN